MPLITTDTGNVNLRRGSAKVSIWHCPRTGGAGGVRGNEKVLIAASMDTGNPAVTVQGYIAPRAAVMHLSQYGAPPQPADLAANGKMQANTYTIADHEVIKVSASLHAPWSAEATGLGRTLAMPVGITAMQYYRVRQGAAIVTIKVRMIDDPRCPYKFATLTGPLEKLTVDEAVAAGVQRPAAHFLKGYDARAVSHLFSEEVLQAAKTVVQTVQSATTGDAVQVVAPVARQRALIMPARKPASQTPATAPQP